VLCLVLTLCLVCVLLRSSTVNADKVGDRFGERWSNSESEDITADDLGTQHSAWNSSISRRIHSSRNRNGISRTEVLRDGSRDGGRRITGGEKATGTYRWVAKLETLGGVWAGCVGNLISERWIVTAAHCILNDQNTGYKSAATPGNSKIKYGCLNTESASCKIVDAVRYIAHPCFTPSDDQNHDDIALIELRAPVEGMAGQFAWVNGLNGSISIGDGQDVILAGFGATTNEDYCISKCAEWGMISKVAQMNNVTQVAMPVGCDCVPEPGRTALSKYLMQITVPKRPTSMCEHMNPWQVSKQYVNYNNVICTGGSRGKDSCYGDGGGPAIVMRDARPWLVGVLSTGSELPEANQSCGAEGRVAAYTAVEKYSNWIYAVINNKDFCCRECPVIGPTRNPPWLSCPGTPLTPVTSCTGGTPSWKEDLPTTLPTLGPSATSPLSPSWQIAIVVLVVVIVIGCLFAVIWYCWLRRLLKERSAASHTAGHGEMEMGHRPPVPDVDGRTLAQQETPAQESCLAANARSGFQILSEGFQIIFFGGPVEQGVGEDRAHHPHPSLTAATTTDVPQPPPRAPPRPPQTAATLLDVDVSPVDRPLEVVETLAPQKGGGGLGYKEQMRSQRAKSEKREDSAKEVHMDVLKILLEDLDVGPNPLASGSFKEVFLARLLKTIPDIGQAGHKVAVIQLRHGNSTLGAELNVFKTLGRHPNLTRLLAVTCSDSGVVTSLVTEFAELGSLDHVLSDLSERDQSATADVLLTAAMQVLDGMLQLQEHKIVHCDLALRNILVFRLDASECGQVHVKLTDYGLASLASTGTYVQASTSSVGDGVPFRWMSPEAILRRRWSEKSDVWAFAVTVWEMFTHGLVPYTFISSDSEVGQRVVAGHRLERPIIPTECPLGVFDVMLKCWEQAAEARPTFVEVKNMILAEFREGRQGECCICLERKLLSDLLVLVPCGHRCVCANHASKIVGHPCPMCRTSAVHAIRVFD
jgi:secreted trypsin-like serine protease